MPVTPARQPVSGLPDPSETHVLRDVRQLAALRSPVRQQLITLLERSGPSSVRELAERIGMATESLYYHVHALVRAGLLRRTGQRRGATRPEALYEAIARHFSLDPQNRSSEYLDALAKVGSAALRAADRDYRRALVELEPQSRGVERTTDLRQLTVRLPPDAIAGLRQRLDALLAYVLEHETGDGHPCSVTTVVCRVPPERAR